MLKKEFTHKNFNVYWDPVYYKYRTTVYVPDLCDVEHVVKNTPCQIIAYLSKHEGCIEPCNYEEG